jgi:ABC-type glycerol-3-phosphate transport system substrate-binding protein
MVTGTAIIVLSLALTASIAGAVGPQDINWGKPVSVAKRVTAQGPVEEIPEWYDDYGVDLKGKAMLTGYKLPQGWKKAIGGVKKLTLTNSGSLLHDPATALNAKIFEKMTGVHLEIVEMKDALLWPKTLSVLMAKSTDVHVFYSPDPMFEIPHLSAANWAYPVDDLWPSAVQEFFPKKMLRTMKGLDDRFYGSPLVLWALQLYYRPSWLAKAGIDVPKTWQDVVTASKKLDEWAEANLGHGYAGMVFPAADVGQLHNLWCMATYTQGKKIMQGRKAVIDPAAWEIMTDLWLKGGMSKSSVEYQWSDAPEVFAKGKAGLTITSGVYMKKYANPKFGTGIQGDWDVTPVPGWEGVGNRGVSKAENRSWVINRFISPAEKAAAMLLLDYQRSYQACFNELYVEGNESAMPSVYNHPEIKKEVAHPDLRQKAVAGQIGEVYPAGMMDIMEIFKEYLDRVIVEGMDPDAAREKIQAAIDEIM